ncbi:hypothetical protein PG991_009865 [Apiospora marii]|uniref:Aminoglycoside phosphotransferase domain-containing protein n=1 Tax=Apiospora marii TaxID=335849 RepID=A0ABR1RGT9_9PEZI
MSSHDDTRRAGLVWTEDLFQLTPTWEHEPSLDAIRDVCCEHLGLSGDNVANEGEDACTITFRAAGALNRVYTVDSVKGKFIMRVTLPVDPGHKTRGEVSTLRFIRENTSIPVPEVIAFDDTSSSKIGFEWILMEFISGQSLRYCWRKMTMEQKTTLVQCIAELQSQLFQFRSLGNSSTLRGIGTLGTNTDFDIPGRIVSFPFVEGDSYDYDVPRGPFRSSHDWFHSRLQVIQLKKLKEIEHAEDDEDEEVARAGLEASQHLKTILPKIFPPSQTYDAERTAIYHHDLSEMNIMVDNQGHITGIIDWECVSAMPSWMVTDTPAFLRDPERDEEPSRDGYADETEEDRELDRQCGTEDDLDNEGKNTLYWIHLKEYESTQLKKVYDTSMQQILPTWKEMVKDAELQLDFYQCVENASGSWDNHTTCVWAKSIEKGVMVRKDDAIDIDDDDDTEDGTDETDDSGDDNFEDEEHEDEEHEDEEHEDEKHGNE